MKYVFLSTCVGWPRNRVDELHDMIDDAQDITRRTFITNVTKPLLREQEEALGYALHHKQGMTMASDWHVSYHKSRLCGFTVYYFRHSAIEFVFVPEDFAWPSWRTE